MKDSCLKFFRFWQKIRQCEMKFNPIFGGVKIHFGPTNQTFGGGRGAMAPLFPTSLIYLEAKAPSRGCVLRLYWDIKHRLHSSTCLHTSSIWFYHQRHNYYNQDITFSYYIMWLGSLIYSVIVVSVSQRTSFMVLGLIVNTICINIVKLKL